MRAFLLIPLAACGGVVDNFGTESRSFAVADALRVVTETGKVEIEAGAADAIEVTFVQGSTNEGWQDREDGGELVIEGLCVEGEVGCSAGFVIRVPADLAVSVSTTEGVVGLTGLTGAVTAQTTAGPITGAELGGVDLSLLTNAEVDLVFSDTPSRVEVDGGRDPVAVAVPAGGYNLAIDAGGSADVDPEIEDDPSGPSLILDSASDVVVRVSGGRR